MKATTKLDRLSATALALSTLLFAASRATADEVSDYVDASMRASAHDRAQMLSTIRSEYAKPKLSDQTLPMVMELVSRQFLDAQITCTELEALFGAEECEKVAPKILAIRTQRKRREDDSVSVRSVENGGLPMSPGGQWLLVIRLTDDSGNARPHDVSLRYSSMKELRRLFVVGTNTHPKD